MRSASQMQSLLGETFGKTRKNGEAFRKVSRLFSSKRVRYLDMISKILLVPGSYHQVISFGFIIIQTSLT